MNKVCLSQDNFDRLLELALNNCQTSHKNTQPNKNIRHISFLQTNCPNGLYLNNGQCIKCPDSYVKNKIPQNNCDCIRYIYNGKKGYGTYNPVAKMCAFNTDGGKYELIFSDNDS